MFRFKEILPSVWHHYRALPFLTRLLVRCRLRIAPFEWVLPHIHPGDRILEVGCGHGLLANLIQALHPQTRILATDRDKKRVTEALKTIDGRENPVFQVGEGVAKDGERADTVVFFDLLHHLPGDKHRPFLQQAMEKLRPGGKIILKEMVKEFSIPHFLNWLHDKVFTLGERTHYRRIEEWRAMAESLGLQVSHLEKGYKFCYHHCLLVLERR